MKSADRLFAPELVTWDAGAGRDDPGTAYNTSRAQACAALGLRTADLERARRLSRDQRIPGCGSRGRRKTAPVLVPEASVGGAPPSALSLPLHLSSCRNEILIT